MNDIVQNAPSWKLRYVSRHEVFKIIRNLPNKNTAGNDGLEAWFIKLLAKPLAPNMTRLVNMIVTLGTYPRNLVMAKITPIRN